jgi:hypothetical protein
MRDVESVKHQLDQQYNYPKVVMVRGIRQREYEKIIKVLMGDQQYEIRRSKNVLLINLLGG